MCVDVHMSICTLTLSYLCVRSVFDPVPNFTKQNLPIITRITLVIELYTALNCFAGTVKTKKLMGAPFLLELVAVVVNTLFVTVISPTYCIYLKKIIVH